MGLSAENQTNPVNENEKIQQRDYLPQVDIFEDKKEIILYLNVPGASKENVHVNIENKVLSIEADVRTDGYQNHRPLYAEYNVGHFFRKFKITDSIDTEKIKAVVESGVLILTLSKKEILQPKTIEVQ